MYTIYVNISDMEMEMEMEMGDGETETETETLLCTCGWSDADEARGHALHCADNRRLPQDDNVQGYPDQQAGGCADVGVEDRHGRAEVGG